MQQAAESPNDRIRPLSPFRRGLLGNDQHKVGNLTMQRAPKGSFEMPLRCIIRAREDINLVKLVLSRHCSSEPLHTTFPASTAGKGSIPGEFPGRCYGTTRVCFTCFCVYDLIEHARNKGAPLDRSSRKSDKQQGHLLVNDGVRSSTTASTPEARAVARATDAICCLTTLDIAELRSYNHPPPAVSLATRAVFILLSGGKSLDWAEVRYAMANGETFLRSLLEFDCGTITNQVKRAIEPYVHNTLFQPTIMARVSKAASRACLWVLGMLEAHKWHSGGGHERLDFLLDTTNMSRIKRFGHVSSNKGSFAVRISGRNSRSSRVLMGIERQGSKLQPRILSPPYCIQRHHFLSPPVKSAATLRFLGTADIIPVELKNISPNALHRGCSEQAQCALMSQERATRLITQKHQMERLASRPQDRLMNGQESIAGSVANSSRRVFVCADGFTALPYEVLGDPSLVVSTTNFVVVHDMFDTLDSTKIYFRRLQHEHPGCQILVYNYAGQAGTTFLTEEVETRKHSQHLNDLLKHINLCGEMLLSRAPFFLAGIGYGFNICAQFATQYCNNPGAIDASLCLKGLISVNGFTKVDGQYAAIMHALNAALLKFPNDRPDLPISYFSRFQFSDGYLARVHPQLALNIYTAIANPITVQGRLALVRGAMKSPPGLESFSGLPLPIFAIQSTENVLVVPSNVEALVRGRITRHIWSHQVRVGAWEQKVFLGPNARAVIQKIGDIRETNQLLSCVVWVRSGHEVRQEVPSIVIDLFNSIAPWTSEEIRPMVNFKSSTAKPKNSTHSHTEVQTHACDDANVLKGNGTCYSEAAIIPQRKPDESLLCVRNAASSSEFRDDLASNKVVRESQHASKKTISSTRALVFAVLFPGFAIHDFTKRRRSALLKKVSINLAEAIDHVGVESITVETLHAGSVIVNARINIKPADTSGEGTGKIDSALAAALALSGGKYSLLHSSVRREANADRFCGNQPAAAAARLRISTHASISTSRQRHERLYTNHVQTASEAIVRSVERNGSISRAREFAEMQRQVNVDAAEVDLVRGGIVPTYAPPADTPDPVLHPRPANYDECEEISSITNRRVLEDVFLHAGVAQNPAHTLGQDSHVENDVKREAASAQLLREWTFLVQYTQLRINHFSTS
mmetsp:Transcript_18106/g.55073  ORF Transcript_18106/g.55073 Transcript_18106/m.55073 type:complete len:1145 (+) Transcript_18106:2007-5441(+)